MSQVALIHTSFVFINREKMLFEIFADLLPDVELINIVDDAMLREVMSIGNITPEINKRMCLYVLAAEAMGVDAIFNTCSSLGPAFDIAKRTVSIPAIKIDEGMAIKAAEIGKKIAVLATVPTTLPPTVAIIKEKASIFNKQLEIKEVLSKGAFELLMNNETTKHDEMVSQTVLSVSNWADTLVLAQASMTRLAPRLSRETNLPVLTSPELGIKLLKEILTK